MTHTRKPVCPVCKGTGGWHATPFRPYEDCEVCGGAGHVSKRTAVRLSKRANIYRQWRADYVPGAHLITDIDEIPF